MNLYRGCQHGCIYCDSRSKCYQIENFSDILIKENALELLEKELRSKKKKNTIGFGSMNDPYMPIEEKTGMARKALEIIRRYNFPVHIITKSSLITRDIDLLKQIGKTYTAASITITTSDDKLSKIIEPGAPASNQRFETIKELSRNGIYCGILIIPTLPYITDSWENIESIVLKAKESGAQYILSFFGMTQREGQREYFHNQLEKYFPGLKEKYLNLYGNNYNCNVPKAKELSSKYYTLCKKLKIETQMRFYQHKEGQTYLFD
jgi:DNA repair photolyase